MDSLDLTSLLTNLQLQPTLAEPETVQFSKFTLFPTLPTELRLKILSHAIPTFGTLPVHANIAVADPGFGLYCTFAPAAPASGISNSFSSFTSASVTKPQLFKDRRAKNLLLVNKEFCDYYTEQFPLSLPTGKRGTGKIRFASCETVYIKNFDALLKDDDFVRAMKNEYRRQDFWNEIQFVAVPITSLIQQPRPMSALRPEVVLRRFKRAREVKACLWEGFEEKEHEEARARVKRGMERHLVDLRDRLVGLGDLEGNEGRDGVGEYVVPRIVLVGDG